MDNDQIVPNCGQRSPDFTLHLINIQGEQSGALLFVAPGEQEAQAFLRSLIDMMFPPGGRGSSYLSVETSEDGTLVYEARSGVGHASITLRGVPGDVGRIVRHTLQTSGSLPIIFGFLRNSEIVVIEPTRNYIMKTDAYVDNEHIIGSRVAPRDWSEFLRGVARDNPTVSAEIDL
jgi:hypothetical protein